MSTATSLCFYCSNSINRSIQPHVYANIRHNYKNGDSRESDRNFHLKCFEKFERVGRPFNPETDYTVLSSEVISPADAD